MVKLTWTEISVIDLNQIYDYIALDSRKYASITVHRIYKRAHDIIQNPFIGRRSLNLAM